MKYIPISIGFLSIAFVIYQLLRINRLVLVSKKLVEQTAAFSVIPEKPTTKIIIGDSLGVGIGASSPEYSIAGKVSKDYSQAEIRNLSVSGLRIHGGLVIVQSLKKKKWLILF